MTFKLLALALVTALLTTGCAKTISSSGTVSEHRSRIDFHSRDMIVPDFNGGRTVRCPDINTTS